MGIETAAFAAGGAISAYGQYESARQQSLVAKEEAKNRRLQAEEIVKRVTIETGNIQQEGRDVVASQQGALAKGGAVLGTGLSLTVMEDTNTKILTEIDNMRRDAFFRVDQLRRGADYSDKAAKQTMTAGKIQAAGTLLSAGAKAKQYA